MAVGGAGPEAFDAAARSADDVADACEAPSPSELQSPLPLDRMGCQQVLPKVHKIYKIFLRGIIGDPIAEQVASKHTTKNNTKTHSKKQQNTENQGSNGRLSRCNKMGRKATSSDQSPLQQ